MRALRILISGAGCLAALATPSAAQQTTAKPPTGAAEAATAATAVKGAYEDYVIGPEDVLTIQFWRDDTMSGDVVVRPDGKITVRLLNDLTAAGLTPMQLRDVLMKAATRFLEDPTVTVGVKQIKSRTVMVMGEVQRTGPLPLNGPMDVLTALGMAGGPTEYAKLEQISIIRTENGQQKVMPFDYNAIKSRRKLEQNIQLKPGDKILVP